VLEALDDRHSWRAIQTREPTSNRLQNARSTYNANFVRLKQPNPAAAAMNSNKSRGTARQTGKRDTSRQYQAAGMKVLALQQQTDRSSAIFSVRIFWEFHISAWRTLEVETRQSYSVRTAALREVGGDAGQTDREHFKGPRRPVWVDCRRRVTDWVIRWTKDQLTTTTTTDSLPQQHTDRQTAY